MSDRQLSPHFRSSEFTCRDGSPLPDNFTRKIHDTIEFLERLRFLMNAHIYRKTGRYLDLGLKVVSGHRSLAYNKRIGSKPTSRHVTGRAADVRPAGGYTWFSYADFCDMAELVDLSFPDRPYRIGKYSHLGRNAFLHIDCGYGHGGIRWGK